jgi:hypothetical protein
MLCAIEPDNNKLIEKLDEIDSTKYSLMIKAKKLYLDGNKEKSSELVAEAIKINTAHSVSIFIVEKIKKDFSFIKKIVEKINILDIKKSKNSLNDYGDFLSLAGFYKEAKKVYIKTGDKVMVKVIEIMEKKNSNKFFYENDLFNFLNNELKNSKNDKKKILYKLSLILFENIKNKFRKNKCNLDDLEKKSENIKNYTSIFTFSILNKISEKSDEYFKKNFKLMDKKYLPPIYYPYIVRTMNDSRVVDNEFMPITFWKLDENFIYRCERLPIIFFLIGKLDKNNLLLENYIKEWKILINKYR